MGGWTKPSLNVDPLEATMTTENSAQLGRKHLKLERFFTPVTLLLVPPLYLIGDDVVSFIARLPGEQGAASALEEH